MLIGKRVKQLLLHGFNDKSGGETSMEATAEKAKNLGLIEITDRWLIRGGNPGASAMGIKPGTWCIIFSLTEKGKRIRDQILLLEEI